MKKLILLRHAKSDWDDPSLHDHDRPLNRRGERDAPAMGKLLKGLGIIPDLIVSSTALRAKMTAEGVATGLGYDARGIQFTSDLYMASASKMLEVARLLPGEKNTVFIVSHNPGITYFLSMITGNYQTVPDMPTCAVAVLELEGEWSGSAPGAFMLRSFLTPKKDLFR